MLGTNLRCLDNLNGIWGFDTSNSLQTTSIEDEYLNSEFVRADELLDLDGDLAPIQQFVEI